MTLSYAGQVIANNQGSVSILITEPMGSFCFYRGENGDYGSFRASFQRDNIGSFNHCKKFFNLKSNLKTVLKNELKKQEYFFDESCFLVDKNTQTIMQKEIEETIIPWINQYIQPARLCYKPI